MAKKIIFTCSQLPLPLPGSYQFCEALDLVECELLEGETSRQALDKAKDVGLTVMGWSVEVLTGKLSN